MHHQHHHSSSTSSKHGGSGKRSKSKERRHRSSGDWWSSDDNLDSDGTFRAHGMLRARQQAVASEHAVQHCPPLEHTSGHFGRLSLKTSKSSGDIKCSACKGAPPDGKFLKRSSWSTLTVSQAKEAYRKSSLNLDKPSSLHHEHMGHRLHHYLQVSHMTYSRASQACFRGQGILPASGAILYCTLLVSIFLCSIYLTELINGTLHYLNTPTSRVLQPRLL